MDDPGSPVWAPMSISISPDSSNAMTAEAITRLSAFWGRSVFLFLFFVFCVGYVGVGVGCLGVAGLTATTGCASTVAADTCVPEALAA